MFRSLCSTVTGLVALAGLAVTAACGLLPDAGPAVERMQHNAAEQGLDGEVRFLARSIGGLGTAPHVTVSGQRATPEDLERLLELLRQSEQVARDMRTERLGVSVRMTVEDGHADLLPTLAGRLRSLDRGTWAFARVDGMTLKTVVGGSLGAPRGEPGGGGVAGDPREAVIWIPTCPYG